MSLFVEDKLLVFVIMTVIIGGGLAFLAGRSLATRWRPAWKAVMFMIPLGAALRFFHYALFTGDLSSVHYFVSDTLVLIAGVLLGYRLTRVRQMVTQYPWAYERTSLFSYREKPQS
jgi:hypothetical protein